MTGLGSWVDGSGGGTPIDAANLNARDGILTNLGGAVLLTPTSPNAKDDEFDGTSSVTWSNTPNAPSVASHNSSVPGALYLESNVNNAWAGRVQAVPGSTPYTITTRVLFLPAVANYAGASIVLGPASPTTTSTVMTFGAYYRNGAMFNRWTGTFAGTFSSEVYTDAVWFAGLPILLRVTVNSSTSVDLAVSRDGRIWRTHTAALNPGFTPGVMGLATMDSSASTRTGQAAFDFFRVT